MRSLFLWLILALCSPYAAQAQTAWLPVGPFGGDARSLTLDPAHPDRVLAGTSAGELYVSNDFGKDWQRFARVGKGNDFVLDHLAIDPTDGTIFVSAWALTHEGGALFRSRDNGKTWQSLPPLEGKSIRAMAISHSDPRIIVVGALDGVFRSNDSGDTWERISPSDYAELKNIESIAIDPADPRVIYAGTWHLPWKTADGGKTWHSIKSGVIDDSDVFSIIIDPQVPAVVYASACSGIYRSDSAGELFRKVQGIPYTARRTRVLRQDAAHRDTVYAGTTEGLWKTADAGQSWKRMTPANVIVNDVLIDPRDSNHILLATDRGGMLASTDGGSSFTTSNKGYTHRQIATLLIPHNDAAAGDIYVGVLNDKEFGGVFVSHDLGASWTQASNGLNGRDVFTLQDAGSGELIAGTNNGIFYRLGSSDWRPINDIVEQHSETIPGKRLKHGKRTPSRTVVKQVHSTLNARVSDLVVTRTAGGEDRWYAAGNAGLFLSADRGKTWSMVSPNAPKGLVSVAVHGNDILAASRMGIGVSTDAGVTWREPKLPNINNIVSVAIAPDGSQWVAAREGAFRSTDHGATWTYLWGLPVKEIAFMAWDDSLERMLATGVDSTDLYQSADGSSWSRLDAGWLLRAVSSSNGRVIAATAFDGVVLGPATPQPITTAQR